MGLLAHVTGLIGSGHAAAAAELAQHALRLMHESAESVNYECELEECAGFAQELHRQACLAADVDRRALAEWPFDAVVDVLARDLQAARQYTRICQD
jgi:hypothetical protein